MKIYCCHPISGCSAADVFKYYEDTSKMLDSYGYQVLTPMHGKGILRTEMAFKAVDYRNPVSTNHAIFNRDRWMVTQADVIYANLLGAKIVSIGTVMELAWASDKGKHVVLVMEEENIHRHAFVLEAATIIWTTEAEALTYLKNLAGKLTDEMGEK
jgi:nucleoside 2-deoxyribosyltransferase